MRRSFAVAFSAAASIWWSSGVAGACQTTTCDADPNAICKSDANGCSVEGAKLYWPEQCAWFGVQQDGSSVDHISYSTFHSIVTKAFAKWAAVDCGGGRHPNFGLQDTDELYGPVVCDQHEYNATTANASEWLFRANWPADYDGVLALTTLTIDKRDGQILDADVEVDGEAEAGSGAPQITTSESSIGNEKSLDAIVTHESGHFLGLAHSTDPTATMYKEYSDGIETLAADDVTSICGVYPGTAKPTCPEPAPLSGFSRYCGGINPSTQPVPQGTRRTCSIAPSEHSAPSWWLVAPTALGIAALRKRRHRTREDTGGGVH